MTGHDAGLVAVRQVVDAVVDRQRGERRDQAPAARVAADRRQRSAGAAGGLVGEIVLVSTVPYEVSGRAGARLIEC